MNEARTYETGKQEERVILVAVEREKENTDAQQSLDELQELARTAGAVSVGRMIQRREAVHRAHYLGKGKLEELKAYIAELDANGIICDDELTPNQMKNLEDILNVKIMNRTLLILDIFASRAVSAEGKLQVELAQLKYSLSHLVGLRKNLSRLGGGIGTRGPGEKKLETDRRNISERISELQRSLKDIERHRQVMREKRMKSSAAIVALVGYTNAGKSTLMNKITNADVLAENKLFATLDTTTRKIELPSGGEYIFTDTVGFIQKLPHNLIQAFKATLEEVKYADILVHVVDVSNAAAKNQMDTVYKTLKELGCEGKPIITVYNKTDKDTQRPFPNDIDAVKCMEISAKTGKGVDELLSCIEDTANSFKKRVFVMIPYDKGSVIDTIYSRCEIIDTQHKAEGVYIECFADEQTRGRLKNYFIQKI